MAVAETLKSNGVTPFTVGTKYRWTAAAWFDYLNMRVNGPQFHIDLMLGKESYTDERVKTVFNDYWAPLIENDYFIDDPASYAWAEAIPFMNNGDAAMYLMGDFIRDSYPEDQVDKLDFFRFPIIDPNVPVGEDAPTDGYFMAANAQHAEVGKELLAYFGSEEVQTKMAEDLGRLVTNGNVSDDVYNEDQIKGRRILDRADYVAQFYDRDTTPEMADAGMNGFMEFWSDPTPAKTDEILQQLEQTRQRLFEEE
ncbi:MAG: extracellular solute-binding protein, partial [Spirochaetes bacterium]|jgi:multiple sugar transport system substrate-binding protein/raffinose/stachyose/melibiose transport system substrate-binding protein|nr:extracellular solute-binding protein [Spirochaetota bacterium]